MNSIKKSNSNYQIYFILIAIIGFALRMSMPNFGIDAIGGDRGVWDSDVEAFQTNLNLLRNGLSCLRNSCSTYLRSCAATQRSGSKNQFHGPKFRRV